jgi:hypothetical protein
MAAKASIKPDVQLETATAWSAPVNRQASSSKVATICAEVTAPDSQTAGTSPKLGYVRNVGRINGIGFCCSCIGVLSPDFDR